MSEPRNKQHGLEEAVEDNESSAAVVISITEGVALRRELEPADDAPTIISRPHGRPARPEDGFANALRGRCLAHYELIDPIGVGGMAAVIRARDTHLDRSVALKILPPEMASDTENIRRFQQEARAAAKLDHENIARVFYCGEDQGLHFISFEFVEGENLRNLLERRGRLPVPEAVRYLLQLAAGLAHAANRGVVHRDIKPSNIIIGPTGKAKLVDMGLARSLEPYGDASLTQSGVTLGTFDYISPEQALEPHEADARSDIYSLGCTFYQALTGQSPVPDGTAAKKLHHHQHVAPADPRQLNPEIPDELAAILARMMAKDPKERYQRPEHLVQHLLELAQRLGIETQGQVGTRFDEAPLPQPPRFRPLLTAALAACLLVAFVLLHGMSSWQAPKQANVQKSSQAGEPPARAGLDSSRTPPAGAPGKVQDPALETPQPSARTIYEAYNAGELADILQKKGANKVVYLAADIDLTPEKAGEMSGRVPGLVFNGGRRDELTIQPKNPRQRPVIRLAYDADLRDGMEETPVWTAFTVKGGKVTLQGLRFEVDARQAPRIIMAAVKLQEGGSLKLENCEFIQHNPPSTAQGRLCSVLVEDARETSARPIASITGCYFTRGQKTGATGSAFVEGQDAVTLQGAAGVQIASCAFAPHAALVHLCDRGTQPADVTVRNSSAFLGDGAVFQIDEGVSARLVAQNDLFSRPEVGGAPEENKAVLIRQTGPVFGTVQFTGTGNRYHNLSAYWTRTHDDMVVAGTWEEFLEAKQVGDSQSAPLNASPWIDKNPLGLLELNQPQQAFQMDVKLPELRQADSRKLVGVDACTWGTCYGELPALEEKKPELPARKIVDPTRETGGGVYNKLAQAVLDARAGDVILIKHTGLLPVDPLRLEKSSLDLTVQAHPGFHPILTLGDTSDPDPEIFHVHDSRVKFEQLEFLLKPRQRDFNSQAVASISGLGQCIFRKCVVTLDAEPGDKARLSAVALADARLMRMDPPAARDMPEAWFENCFVRGRGELIAVRAGRPFDLRVDNCLVALAGSLLGMDGNMKEPSATPAQITLTHVTAYLTENLFLLRTSKNTKDVNPVQVRASDCLFASTGGRALIHFDGEVNDEQLVKRLLSWEGKHNVYSNFAQLLDQQPKGDEMPLAPFGKEKWEAWTRERGVFERVKFETPALEEQPLARALPSYFKVKLEAEAEGAGADLGLLPLPRLEEKAAPAVSSQVE